MKIIIFFALATLFLTTNCDSQNNRQNNPYLPNYSFSILINTNLPTYSGLTSAINPIIINDAATSISVIVMKVTDTDFRAWDINCPNQSPTTCSRMTIKGVDAVCSCDKIEYSLFTGVGTGNYGMKSYSVEVLGNNAIRIYN